SSSILSIKFRLEAVRTQGQPRRPGYRLRHDGLHLFNVLVALGHDFVMDMGDNIISRPIQSDHRLGQTVASDGLDDVFNELSAISFKAGIVSDICQALFPESFIQFQSRLRIRQPTPRRQLQEQDARLGNECNTILEFYWSLILDGPDRRLLRVMPKLDDLGVRLPPDFH